MATALAIITRAMRLAGVIGKGEALDSDESTDGLAALNTMLDSWSIEKLFVYQIVDETLTMVANQQTYTMGSGGDLNTTRPTRIQDSCFIRYATIDIPLQLVDELAWANITVKGVTSILPMYLFADMQYPLVNLNFYPKPSSTSAVAHIKSWKQLQQFTALTTDLALPPGYQRAIEYSLASEFGPEFGASIPDAVVAIAQKARGNIKRLNSQPPVMMSEAGYMTRQRGNNWNVYTGP